jgi:lipopolysaccharide transport system permease protein
MNAVKTVTVSAKSQSPGRPTRDVDLPETIILPDRGWFDWRLRQLWRYRDLIGLFVWRDFVSVYKQTILGPLWHIVRPLITTLIFTVVFSRMAGLSTDGAPPFLFYLVGNVGWSYFANCLDNTSKTFTANAALMGKVYFHRLVIPVSLVVSNLISFGIQLGILLVVMAIYAFSGTPLHVTAWVLLLPILLVILAGYALGGGIVVCAMTTRYRDLNYLVTFGVQLMMYVTPVIYPVSSVPERYRWAANLNPLAAVFEAFRLGFLGVGTVTLQQVAVSFVVMLIMLAAGVMLFTRVERTFMDTV